MIGNIITAVFSGSRTCKTSPLYQYDYGQKMDFRGIPELPVPYEVHFSNQEHGSSKTAIGDETGVIIPDEYLTSGENIYAWVYLHTGADDGETEYRITIPVIKRARPSDAEPTPVQQDAITQAIALLQEESGKAEQSADRAEDAAVRAEEAAASIDEEMIAEAVADYLDDHPVTVEELDPTVPAWAKQATKPTYTAAEVGAVSTAGLSDAIDTALAQAKASGEFDGPQGDDGITPTTTVTTITGGHNVAFSYGTGDSRNTDFDVMDGADGHSPVVTASKTGKVTTVSVDGTAIATINDGEDGATPVKGTDYWTAQDQADIVQDVLDSQEIAALQTKAITDTGGYYTTDTVEGALQEIGAEIAGVNTLIGTGVIS